MLHPINVELNDVQINDVRLAFPELDPLAAAKGLADFAVGELISFFAGKKRYLSLSHQYVEWLEQLNVKLLPEVEFGPGRLMNQLNLPPGSAAYIGRVLRERQNVELVRRGWASLLATFQAVKSDHDQRKPADRGAPGTLWSITLTKRVHRLLILLLDSWENDQQKRPIAERKSFNLPQISENRLDYVKITYTMPDIERLIPVIQRRLDQ